MRGFFAKLDATLSRAAPPASPAPEVQRCTAPPATLDGATLRSPPTPLVGARNDVAPPSAPSAPLPKVVSAPARLKSTEPVQDLPAEAWAQRGLLPFRQVPPGRGAAKTLQVPVAGLEPGKTAPLGDEAIKNALAALPFAIGTAGGNVVPIPRLTLQQYASLCAELSVWPERRGEILRVYQVHSEAGYAALDASWRERFAKQPEARAAFESDLARFTAWLRAQRR